MAFSNIDRPDEYVGIGPFERSNGMLRNPFEGAHGIGDALWTERMSDYQATLDPDGHFRLTANARYNGALVISRTVNAARNATTAHRGKQSNSVDELSWRSDVTKESFLQEFEMELQEKTITLLNQLMDGFITQSEHDSQIEWRSHRRSQFTTCLI